MLEIKSLVGYNPVDGHQNREDNAYETKQSKARQGKTRQGNARQGKEKQGTAQLKCLRQWCQITSVGLRTSADIDDIMYTVQIPVRYVTWPDFNCVQFEAR